MKKLFILLLAFAVALPGVAFAGNEMAELKAQIAELQEELADLDDRMSAPERHAATDRIQFTGDMRVRGNSIHYKDVSSQMGAMVDFDAFGAAAMGGAFGNPMDPNSPIGKMMAQYPALATAFQNGQLSGVGGFGQGVKKYDKDNDIMYNTRLRLNMKAKVWDNVSFDGRLTMFKAWGDSTGVRVMDSFQDVAIDGTGSGYASGDMLRVERAFFNWKDIGDTPFFLSIGRRPSTYGKPINYRENELRGGTPGGHLVNFNFDGVTVGYKAEELFGLEGATIRFCYGQGYESDYGNGSLAMETSLKDTHLGGFNIDVLDDGTNFLQLLAFRAIDVADGFNGLAVFPSWTAQMGMVPNVITRYSPTVNVGDIDLLGATFAREEDNGINWFVSLGYSKTHPNDNFNAMGFGGLMYDANPVMEVTAIDANGNPTMTPNGTYVIDGNESHEGYSIFVGAQAPLDFMPVKTKVGLEYNYGSKYWFNFVQAQDDMVAPKLATRGHVFEPYAIFEINPKMFIKLSGIYYDYKWTGSGSPLGKPKKVEDVKNGTAFSPFPVIDKALDVNASLTIKF